MKSPQAASTSKQLIDSGYLAWLESEIDTLVVDIIRGTDPTDADGLMVARVKMDLPAYLHQIITDNAHIHG